MTGIVATMESGTFATEITEWVVFAIGLAMTPAYLFVLPNKCKHSWRVHALISSIAFVVWAYALGGPFKTAGIYQAPIASLMLIVFTLFSGLLQPRAVEAGG